jgi:hypothetical protein
MPKSKYEEQKERMPKTEYVLAKYIAYEGQI